MKIGWMGKNIVSGSLYYLSGVGEGGVSNATYEISVVDTPVMFALLI